MSRLPQAPRDELPADQQKAHDELASIAKSSFGDSFTFKRKDGALVGPFPFFLASPEIGVQQLQFMTALSKHSPLSKEVREVAILAVGSHYKAAYELYAHFHVATKSTNLSESQVKQISAGEKPSDLNEAESVTFDAARYLSSTPGPMPQQLWDRAEKALGKEGTIAMVHYIGFYAYLCIALNAMDAPVPKEGE